MKLTIAQRRALDMIAERGMLTNGGHGVRYTTVRALERAGLITLDTTVHGAWFGGHSERTHVTREWVARPLGSLWQVMGQQDS